MFNLIEFLKKLFFKKEKPAELEWRDGLVPSPTDFRDINIKDILGSIDLIPLPENYRIPYSLPIKNQGATPQCVGFSCATIKDEKERREQNDVDFDGAWIYQKCKEIDGMPDVKGTYFRAGLQVLQKVGAKPLITSTKQGLPEVFRIGWYARVDCEFETLKRAIIQFGGILAGFRGDNAGWKTAYIKPPKNIEWAHAVVLIGFTKDYLIGQNSWGEDWGSDGLFYVPKDYLPFEAWNVLSDLPTELLPNPDNKPKFFFQNNLYIGLRNEEVRILQDCLKYLGCFPKEQESTGFFGSITQEAVKIFQQRYSISPVSGYVGPLTKAKLNELFA